MSRILKGEPSTGGRNRRSRRFSTGTDTLYLMRLPKKKYALILLALIFIVVLGFFSYQLNTSPSHGLFRKIVLEAASPLEALVRDAAAGTAEMWRRYLFLYGLSDENKRLRQENDRLARKVIAYREAYLENIRLRGLLAFKEKLEYETTAARIIRRDTAGIMKTLMINRGENDGIRKGQPVMVERGLVGRVIETTWHASRILLLIDGGSNVDALIQRTRAHGILQGTGVGGCRLKYIVKTEPVEKGDIVLTSGLGGVFPRELVLGVVTAVEQSPAGMFQHIEVGPFVDFRKMEEVLVITGKW